MNKLFLGFSKKLELPKSGFLLIDDEPIDIPRARTFDPLRHSLNPLKDITYKRARELADVLYTIAPQGENTLTVRNGKRALLQALLKANRLDRIKGDEEVTGITGDLLASPILKGVLCNPTNFSFNPYSVVVAKLDRKVLGDFDALVLGLFLINHFKGQVVVKDFGFYGRLAHISLIRENRLIAGVNFLDELPLQLRQAVLMIKDKEAHGALYDDAEILAKYAGLRPDRDRDDNPYNDFVMHAMK